MHSRTPQLLTSRQVWILTVVGTLTHVAFSGSRVTVSLAAIHLGASELVVGTLVAFFSIVPTLLAVKAGRMLDRMDPLKPMMVSVAFHVLGVLVPVIFPGLWSLLVASIMVGTASSFFYLLQQRIIGTCSAAPERTANLGIAAIGYAVSGFIGPLASGVAIDHLVSTFHGVHILVLSGDRQDRTTLARSIKTIITTAEIMQAADASVAQNLLTSEVDLAVVDIDSDAEGGLATLRAAKTLSPPVPTVAITSSAKLREAARLAGADEFATNPPPFAELQLVLVRALSRPVRIDALSKKDLDVEL